MTLITHRQGIDPLTEEIITPNEATNLYPRGSNGKKVHVSKIYRDMKNGSHGVVLESIRTPRLATSRQAVARFFHRLSEPSSTSSPASPGRPAPAQTRHEVDQELDRLGL